MDERKIKSALSKFKPSNIREGVKRAAQNLDEEQRKALVNLASNTAGLVAESTVALGMALKKDENSDNSRMDKVGLVLEGQTPLAARTAGRKARWATKEKLTEKFNELGDKPPPKRPGGDGKIIDLTKGVDYDY
ncbi:MAG: hypothetical protein PHE27_02290 [Alphaproteobacteria bacterium]|nr:hypothetical protein [Alphaproteobacteria bacterium]